MQAVPRAEVLGVYRQFLRLLRWWPEQREDETCFKGMTKTKVYEQFKAPCSDEEISKRLAFARSEYTSFVNIASNIHREEYKREYEHIVPEEAKRAATLLSKEVQEKVAKGKWTIIDKLSNMDMPESTVIRNK